MIDVVALIKRLEGSCLSLEEVLEEQEAEFEDMTAEDCGELDQTIMCCDSCGWWYETSEMNTDGGDTLCEECAKVAGRPGDE